MPTRHTLAALFCPIVALAALAGPVAITGATVDDDARPDVLALCLGADPVSGRDCDRCRNHRGETPRLALEPDDWSGANPRRDWAATRSWGGIRGWFAEHGLSFAEQPTDAAEPVHTGRPDLFAWGVTAMDLDELTGGRLRGDEPVAFTCTLRLDFASADPAAGGETIGGRPLGDPRGGAALVDALGLEIDF